MNIVESWASSRLSTSILTAIPLYASTAVAMLAETVGAPTFAPCLSRSRSMSSSPRTKRWRLRGSRTSSVSASVAAAGPRKNVSGGCVASRGRGEAMSIQRASPPSFRQACRIPTGTIPQAPGRKRTAWPSRSRHGSPASTKKLSSYEWTWRSTCPSLSVLRPSAMCTAPVSTPTSGARA